MMSTSAKAATFQALHKRPGCFVIPNPWDAGTAKLLQSLGFEALATTSAGLAFSLGRPDSEGALTRDEILLNAKSIVEATDLPVSADLEAGFGPDPQAVAETIGLAANAGLVGGSIEDATGDADVPIFEFECCRASSCRDRGSPRLRISLYADCSGGELLLWQARLERYYSTSASLPGCRCRCTLCSGSNRAGGAGRNHQVS
jgi:hypothetical protein